MSHAILITGATDGIGRETALRLAAQGHKLILHGRTSSKLDAICAEAGQGAVGVLADMTDLAQVAAMADQIAADHDQVDVVINNAGVLKTPRTTTPDGQDVRFVVNTLAPIVLTQRLLPKIPATGRVLNLSSAAQAPVTLKALRGGVPMADMDAYAQSKLAFTMWSAAMAGRMPNGPSFIAVNPGSLLASKMVKEGFGIAGNDIGIGADILVRLAVTDLAEGRSGAYFDNDAGAFGPPHGDAQNASKVGAVVAVLDEMTAGFAA